jgi:hypothetical protein
VCISLGCRLDSFVYSWFNVDEHCMAFVVVVVYSVNVVDSEVYWPMVWPLLCLCIEVSCPLFSRLAKVLHSVVFSIVLIVKFSDGRCLTYVRRYKCTVSRLLSVHGYGWKYVLWLRYNRQCLGDQCCMVVSCKQCSLVYIISNYTCNTLC